MTARERESLGLQALDVKFDRLANETQRLFAGISGCHAGRRRSGTYTP